MDWSVRGDPSWVDHSPSPGQGWLQGVADWFKGKWEDITGISNTKMQNAASAAEAARNREFNAQEAEKQRNFE